jgi:hypothetical protein
MQLRRVGREAKMYARFLYGLRDFLRTVVTVDQARAGLQRRLEMRAESLVLMAERGFFGAPNTPYAELLRLAGCELGDFRASVRDAGVDATLTALRQAGVYFTFEEFKGRAKVVRHGREIPLDVSQFDNPYLAHYHGHTSGGTTGAATRVSTDLEHLALQAEHRLLCLDAHGVLDVPCAIWRPPLPSGSGINSVLRAARFGRPVARWFTPLTHNDFRPSLKYRLANSATITIGRALGADLAWPEPVALDEAIRIARWMVETRERHGGAVLNTTVSNGLRIALAASHAGLDLGGTHLMLAGEAATPAKVAAIRASGVTLFTDYGAAECGRIGIGCARGTDASDVHLLLDAVAVVAWPRTVPDTDEPITSFHVTALHPAAAKLLLNVEFDDFGMLETRDCGCALGQLGLTSHLREIRSFAKLVGEGVSLLGSEMTQILEQTLPATLGGSPLDYQLVEEEDEAGFTRLTLIVSPTVPIARDEDATDALLAALRASSAAADVARAFWQQGHSFRVRRAQPYVTPRGKQLPIHSLRRLTRAGTR